MKKITTGYLKKKINTFQKQQIFWENINFTHYYLLFPFLLWKTPNK